MNVHKQVMERLEDPEFKKRSEQAKKNKLSGVENGVIHPGHIQGSISTHEVAERLVSFSFKVSLYICIRLMSMIKLVCLKSIIMTLSYFCYYKGETERSTTTSCRCVSDNT